MYGLARLSPLSGQHRRPHTILSPARSWGEEPTAANSQDHRLTERCWPSRRTKGLHSSCLHSRRNRRLPIMYKLRKRSSPLKIPQRREPQFGFAKCHPQGYGCRKIQGYLNPVDPNVSFVCEFPGAKSDYLSLMRRCGSRWHHWHVACRHKPQILMWFESQESNAADTVDCVSSSATSTDRAHLTGIQYHIEIDMRC